VKEKERAILCSVDQLLSQTLSNRLYIPERRLPGPNGEQSNRLVDSSKRRHIYSLTSHRASRSNTGTVLAGSTVDNGINGDLNGILIGEEVDDVKGVLDNTDCHQLFTVVAAVHHERVCEPFDDRALGFAETFRGIAACCVREIDGGADLDVVAARCQLYSRHRGAGGGVYVREMSLTSTSSKDHLLKSLIEPSPTISGGRMALWVATGASSAIDKSVHATRRNGGRDWYRRTWLQADEAEGWDKMRER
jgi:hypothetical protein